MDPQRTHSSTTRRGGDDCAERLSCLLDGELGADDCRALVERLRDDPEACRTWALMNCVGDAMRSSDVAAWHSPSFVGRVSAALDVEPTVLAPAALPRSAARRWLLPGAGIAAAAVVILAVALPARQTGAPSGATVARAPAAPVQATATAEVMRSPQLERYLAAHRELAEPSLMPDATSYLRTSVTVPMQEGR